MRKQKRENNTCMRNKIGIHIVVPRVVQCIVKVKTILLHCILFVFVLHSHFFFAIYTMCQHILDFLVYTTHILGPNEKTHKLIYTFIVIHITKYNTTKHCFNPISQTLYVQCQILCGLQMLFILRIMSVFLNINKVYNMFD